MLGSEGREQNKMYSWWKQAVTDKAYKNLASGVTS